jgi:hypothetical protein
MQRKMVSRLVLCLAGMVLGGVVVAGGVAATDEFERLMQEALAQDLYAADSDAVGGDAEEIMRGLVQPTLFCSGPVCLPSCTFNTLCTQNLVVGLNGSSGTQGVVCINGNSYFQPEYAYFYRTTLQPLTYGNPVIFDSVGLITEGIMNDSGTGIITIVNAGVYEIMYVLSTSNDNSVDAPDPIPNIFYLDINGSGQPDASISGSFAVPVDGTPFVSNVIGNAFFQLPEGTTIQLNNATLNSLAIINPTIGTGDTAYSYASTFTIKRIG